MHGRKGTLVTAAGAFALVLAGGPMVARPAQAAAPSVVVQPGDTLSVLADRLGINVTTLVALNHLSNPDVILPGQLLIVGPDAPAQTVSSAPTPRPAVTLVTHVVSVGEHLTAIAHRYKTTVLAIVAANHMVNANRILVGQQLKIPVPASKEMSPTATAATIGSYRVRAGETLTAIAARYRTSVERLVQLNPLPNPSFIMAGTLLRVPLPITATPSPDEWSTAHFPAEAQVVMARRAQVRDLIIAEARRAGVPVRFALAVAWQESGWRRGVVSSAGAVGVMQVLPDTADWIGEAMLGASVNIHDSRQNVRAGVTLLKHYLLRYKGNRRLALAAYYQGQRSADRYGVLPVSGPYIASILLLEELLEP
jgi:LysM repeat protein